MKTEDGPVFPTRVDVTWGDTLIVPLAADVDADNRRFYGNRPSLHEVNCERVNSLIAAVLEETSDAMTKFACWLLEWRDRLEDLRVEIQYGEDFWL